ncbi:phage holin [Alicyclobacillus cycloheptanicus]|jgi:LL-H family phage holin|uniref:LL-H family phage holin n=1 Tax=Alicyclobacillus cycloheptanicus TaxID=1457 RepID=A0ABT9XGH9_9BACL|nr:phage holin [Alicyclobacillus cycloheptanicus]MDQ0189230.1 LL-H family phage holin [Alicyclobacillus cycloheptanicus]WDM00414.1 phage holin [Alicyclobacillus cycloheptanicus]
MHQLWITVLNRALLLLLQLVVVSVLVLMHRFAPVVKVWLDRHTTLTERKILAQVGKEAFQYAESAFFGAPGQVKLDQALKYAAAIANRKGVSVTENEMRAAIEQAVQEAKVINRQSTGSTATGAAGQGVANSDTSTT